MNLKIISIGVALIGIAVLFLFWAIAGFPNNFEGLVSSYP